jgi:hypothetical protein
MERRTFFHKSGRKNKYLTKKQKKLKKLVDTLHFICYIKHAFLEEKPLIFMNDL